MHPCSIPACNTPMTTNCWSRDKLTCLQCTRLRFAAPLLPSSHFFLLTHHSVRTSSEVRSIREIARELTQRGAALHELLGTEEQLRLARQSALSRNPDLKEIENHISRTVSAISGELQATEKQIQSLLLDQRTLDGKIEKKRQDLERYEKRLRSLQTVPLPLSNRSCFVLICY